ncbi:MAG: hypothetical protein JKX92_12285 [Porticoccaceae bacterium]|nr:hypothetical protein [Porticoccaceae bacterium]
MATPNLGFFESLLDDISGQLSSLRKQRALLFIMVIVAWLCPSPVQAAPTTDVINEFNISRVYDGDTFFINLPVETCQYDVLCRDLGVRLIGVDTAEIKGAKCPKERVAAFQARDFVRAQLQSASSVSLLQVKRDRNFRIDAIVVLDGQRDLASLVIAAGHGVLYDGKEARSQDWCL